jgi:hypothetical protein
VPVYHINEGALDLPPGWGDKSVTAFSFPSGSKRATASLTITREALDPSQKDVTLASHIDRHLIEMAKSCPKFELVRRETTAVDGAPAAQVEFTWRTPERVTVHQEQTMVILPNRVVFTFTGTAPHEKFAEHAPALRDMVRNFRFRPQANPTA